MKSQLSSNGLARLVASNKNRIRAPLTLAAREKISASNKGKVRTPEHRAKISATHKGKPKTDEHRAKISAANKGKNKGKTSHNKHTKEYVVTQLKIIYEGKYRVRDFEYTGHPERIMLQMVCPAHGEFAKNLRDALYSKTGCLKCSGSGFSAKEKYETVQDKYPLYKLERLSKLVVTLNNTYRISMECRTHKVGFSRTLGELLRNSPRHLCPSCRVAARDSELYKSKLKDYPAGRAGYLAYRQSVRRETGKWVRMSANRHLRSRQMHIDHIFSIADGWRLGIEAEIVGHITNLRFLTAAENQSKSTKSSKTKKQLLADYRKFRKEKL